MLQSYKSHKEDWRSYGDCTTPTPSRTARAERSDWPGPAAVPVPTEPAAGSGPPLIMKHPTWTGRFRVYPWSCLGHIAQGAAAGVLAAYGHHWPAGVWSVGFGAYQGLSFARKVSQEGRGDTAGLDAFDFVVGFLPGYAAAAVVRYFVL